MCLGAISTDCCVVQQKLIEMNLIYDYMMLYIGLFFKNVHNWFVQSTRHYKHDYNGGKKKWRWWSTGVVLYCNIRTEWHIFRYWLYDLVMIRKMFKNVKILLWWSKQSKCNHCLLSIPFYFYLKECPNNLFFQEFLPSLITENLENTRIIG